MKNVNAFSNFERTVSITVWKKYPADKSNYLCDEPGCYSTCDGPRFLQPRFQMQCAKCTHPHRSHSHTRHAWVKEVDTQTLVDEGMKKKWEAAKAEKELITTNETRLAQLIPITYQEMDVLVRLVEDYAGLSLSESLSIHVEKVIRLYRDMEEKGVNKEQSTGRLDQMEKKLELLRRTEKRPLKEKARKAVWTVKGYDVTQVAWG